MNIEKLFSELLVNDEKHRKDKFYSWFPDTIVSSYLFKNGEVTSSYSGTKVMSCKCDSVRKYRFYKDERINKFFIKNPDGYIFEVTKEIGNTAFLLLIKAMNYRKRYLRIINL